MRLTFARFPLLLPLLWLAGCTTLQVDTGTPGPQDALAQALQTGDCRSAYTLLEAATSAPGRELQTAQVCLQVGDFERARRVAADFLRDRPLDPDADYAAYLHSLAGFGEWSRASRAEPQTRIREGRALFVEMAGHLRDRPLSQYVEELAPRLVRLREGIADAELALAEREYRFGDRALAHTRAAYVVEYYPRTQAAADAARLLISIGND